MGAIHDILEVIKAAFRFIANIVRKVISGVLNFAREVVGWFRGLLLDPQKDTPFLANGEQFRELLKTAPTKNVGIFEGVYNEDADEITANRYLDADEVDDRTKQVLGNEPLVVLK